MQTRQLEYLPVEALTPYANNARTHSEQQIGQIAASIERFGFTNPVLIGDDQQIIAGHGRVAAARRLGMSEVPVLMLSHLSTAERRAYILADNKLAENAGWDKELLAIELQGLIAFGAWLHLRQSEEEAWPDGAERKGRRWHPPLPDRRDQG
jgi:ParB-like chromosome segregation protein Spo0J